MKTLLILLLFQWQADQFQLMENDKSVGYVSATKETLWLKVDYFLCDEFKIKFIERKPSVTTYYVEREGTTGYITVDYNEVNIRLLINKQWFKKDFKKSGENVYSKL